MKIRARTARIGSRLRNAARQRTQPKTLALRPGHILNPPSLGPRWHSNAFRMRLNLLRRNQAPRRPQLRTRGLSPWLRCSRAGSIRVHSWMTICFNREGPTQGCYARCSIRRRTARQMSGAACGRPNALAARASSSNFFVPSNCSRRNGRSSTRFAFAAAPCSRRKSLFAASWPGMGFRMNNGLPIASASEVVSPPGLEIISSANAISSCMLRTNPSRCVGCRRS